MDNTVKSNTQTLEKLTLMLLIFFTGCIICIQSIPTLCSALEYNRHLILNNHQFWRLFTGNFCHWGWRHLFWDSIVFIICGYQLLKHSPQLFWLITIFSTLLTTLTVYLFNPEFEIYRGISGVDCTFVTSLLTIFLIDSCKNKNHLKLYFCLILFLGIILKTTWELTTKSAFFAGNNFVAATSTHITGYLLGIILTLVYLQKK